MIQRLRARPEWKFFGVLPKARRPLAIAWWGVLILRGLLPALFAIAMGLLVGAVGSGAALGAPLALAASVFVLLQVLSPLHQAIGANLGSQTAAWLYDQLTIACIRPPGMGHLEDPRLITDLTMARDFDLGITGPPLATSMDFIASGLVESMEMERGGPLMPRSKSRAMMRSVVRRASSRWPIPGGRTQALVNSSYSQAAARLPRLAPMAWLSGESTWSSTNTTPTKVRGAASGSPRPTAPMAMANNAGSAPRSRSTDHHPTASGESAFGRTAKNFHSGRARRRWNTIP